MTRIFKTLIYQEELDHIAGWVQEYPELETGGDLFGFWTHSGFPIVQFVLGPGEKSRHNFASFYQDKEHLIKSGKILRNKHGLQHIGEWHSHHKIALAQPSSGDEQTVFNALRQYDFPKFLLCIANLYQEGDGGRITNYKVNVGCFLFTPSVPPSVPPYQTGAWVVLPGRSPIRKDLGSDEHGSLSNNPTRNTNWKVERTTLEEQQSVSTEPIEISSDIWYSTTKGKALLKEIFEGLKSHYENCEMFRTPSQEIYFKFEKRSNDVNLDQWRLELPNNFPKCSARIKVNHRETSEIKDWHSDYQQLKQIEDCIQRYYDGSWRP